MHRIAVIEDSPDNRLLVRAILDEQFSLEEYEGGEDAFVGLCNRPVDLVLLYISLPGIDGVEILRRIRAMPSLCHVNKY